MEGSRLTCHITLIDMSLQRAPKFQEGIVMIESNLVHGM